MSQPRIQSRLLLQLSLQTWTLLFKTLFTWCITLIIPKCETFNQFEKCRTREDEGGWAQVFHQTSEAPVPAGVAQDGHHLTDTSFHVCSYLRANTWMLPLNRRLFISQLIDPGRQRADRVINNRATGVRQRRRITAGLEWRYQSWTRWERKITVSTSCLSKGMWGGACVEQAEALKSMWMGNGCVSELSELRAIAQW